MRDVRDRLTYLEERASNDDPINMDPRDILDATNMLATAVNGPRSKGLAQPIKNS